MPTRSPAWLLLINPGIPAVLLVVVAVGAYA